MIAFGLCIGSREKYESYALPGIETYGETGAPVACIEGAASIFEAYNEILDAFTGNDGASVTGLVLMHEDVEIRDPLFIEKAERLVSLPDVAVAGVIGASGIKGLAWWEANARGRCDETRGLVDFGGGEHDVDVVDGLMMILSPWAISSLRFDEKRYKGFHGYDMDYCLEARSHGKRVIVSEIDVFHHTKGGYGDRAQFNAIENEFKLKWRLV